MFLPVAWLAWERSFSEELPPSKKRPKSGWRRERKTI